MPIPHCYKISLTINE